jgi:Fe-S-cluster containining protein
MEINLKALEKRFHADGYRLAMQAVHEGLTREAVYVALQKMYFEVDEMIRSFLVFAESKGQKADCREGCSWCCYQPVFALSYELDGLNDYVKKHFDASVRAQITERAALKRKKLNGLDSERILQSKIPCPFLENGSCMVYPVRPVACRVYLSTDLNSCLKFYHTPEDEHAVPALLSVPRRLGSMLNEGFKAALKINGYAVDERRIEEGAGLD